MKQVGSYSGLLLLLTFQNTKTPFFEGYSPGVGTEANLRNKTKTPSHVIDPVSSYPTRKRFGVDHVLRDGVTQGGGKGVALLMFSTTSQGYTFLSQPPLF